LHDLCRYRLYRSFSRLFRSPVVPSWCALSALSVPTACIHFLIAWVAAAYRQTLNRCAAPSGYSGSISKSLQRFFSDGSAARYLLSKLDNTRDCHKTASDNTSVNWLYKSTLTEFTFLCNCSSRKCVFSFL